MREGSERGGHSAAPPSCRAWSEKGRTAQSWREANGVCQALVRVLCAADWLDAAVGEPVRGVYVKARSDQGFSGRGVRRQRHLQVRLARSALAHLPPARRKGFRSPVEKCFDLFLLFSRHSSACLPATGVRPSRKRACALDLPRSAAGLPRDASRVTARRRERVVRQALPPAKTRGRCRIGSVGERVGEGVVPASPLPPS